MSQSVAPTASRLSRRFHRLSIASLVIGALLIWVGAAVTTTGSGMAFADWPLSNGSVNPPDWLYIEPQTLEHGHRLLAATVGLLVLAMFLWQWRRAGRAALLPVALITTFVIIMAALRVADGIFKGSGQSSFVEFFRNHGWTTRGLWILAGMLWTGVIVWLVRGLIGKVWPVMLKLTASALVVVVAQAVFGGLRVLENSDWFAVAHGCTGQLLYCLLIAITLVSSPGWPRWEVQIPEASQHRMVLLASMLFIATSVQLLLGAMVRHTQRVQLAATDVLTTNGYIIPPWEPVAAFAIFLHKFWGIIVFILAITTGVSAARYWRVRGWLSGLPRLLLVLPLVQVTLGMFVLKSGKKFWVTNLHVLNGLAILATAFVVVIIAWRSRPLSHHDHRR